MAFRRRGPPSHGSGAEVYLFRIGDILEKIGDADRAEREETAEQPRENTPGVFRLKHAWAAEKEITAGDTDTTVPGVADILRQILQESPGSRRGSRYSVLNRS